MSDCGITVLTCVNCAGQVTAVWLLGVTAAFKPYHI